MFSLAALVLFPLLVALVPAQQVEETQGQCVVEFLVDELASSVELTSRVVRPLPVDFVTSNQQYVDQGVRGSFYAILGPGPCSDVAPTGDDLLEALERGATMSTRAPGTTPDSVTPTSIDFYPYNITLTAETVGTIVNISNLGFDMSLALSTGAARGAEQGNLSGELRSRSSSGTVFTTSIIAPQGESFPFGNHSSVSDAVVIAFVNGSSVELNVTNFNVTMAVPYVSELNPNIDGLTYYRLFGDVLLRGVAGCDPTSCGPNGRCGTTPGGEVACECSCGWSGPSCDISSGYCSDYQDCSTTLLMQQSCPEEETGGIALASQSPALTPSSILQPCVGGEGEKTCSPLFETRNEAGECACKDGFSGPRCEACKTDAACVGLYADGNGARASCGTSVVYSPDTVFKSYTCDLDGTGLETTIVPGTFFVTCNTTNPGADVAVADGAYCSVNFAMQQYPDNPVTCKASICSFVANSSQVNCRTTSCSCERDCSDLDGVFASIQNMPAVIGCDERNQCTFDIKNFFVKLIAPCETTECRVQGYNFEDGSYQVSRNTWIDPLLASIPLIALVSINASLMVFLLRNRDLYFSQGASRVFTLPPAAVAAKVVPPVSDPMNNPRKEVQSLTFRNLSVVLSDHSRRVLLDGVSGEAHVGQVTGIMGPSGSGKTTMISLLSQRSGASNTLSSGSVMLDNVHLSNTHAKIIGYCPQDSFLLPTLTVYETIMYSAILRLPQKTSVETIHRITQESIFKVRLGGVESSYVGGSGRIRGISGGERRRVSVAMEIVTNPKIVLLDEPTSGLDSSSAKQVILALKTLATSGCIVMLSLHQPSPAIFNMIDRVFLLSGGQCLYNGAPRDAESYLNAMGLPMSPGDGVAEFMLECASDARIVEKITNKIRPAHKSSEDIEGGEDMLEYVECVDDRSDASNSSSRPVHELASIATELATLTWRNGLDMIRNPSLLVLHWLLALGMGIFAGCVFFQVNLETSGAQNRAGGIIFALAFFAFTSLTTVDLVFHEKTIVSREVNSGYYRRWTYVVSKLVLDGLFLRFLPILLFSAPFYPMMGLDSDPSNVALFLMTLGTFAITVGALSLAVTFSSSTSGQASFIMNIILLVCLLNSGFFVNAENMPDWISWLRYLSVFFYGYSVLITNEVADLLFQFVVQGYTAVENVRGITFLNILGIDPDQTTNYIIILDCMYAIFCAFALAASYVSVSRCNHTRNVAKRPGGSTQTNRSN